MNNNRTLLIVSILHCFLGRIGAIFFLLSGMVYLILERIVAAKIKYYFDYPSFIADKSLDTLNNT